MNDIRFSPKRRKRQPVKDLPPHVFEKAGRWYVRRNFPTVQRTKSGAIVYVQVVRRCEPHTAERAKAIYDEITGLHDAEIVEQQREDTIESFLLKYLETRKPSIARRTAEGDDELYRRYIKDAEFARLPLGHVTAAVVQEFYSSLSREKVSGAMVRKVHRLLMAAFNLAVIWGKMPAKPKGIILPRPEETEVEFFTKEEARRFSATCLSDPEYLPLALALETGSRPGEYLGLRWSDISLANGTVSVRQAISFLRNGGYEIKRSPKTQKSRRTIHISPQLTAALAGHRERWLARATDLEGRANAAIMIDHPNARRGVNYGLRREIRGHARERLARFRELDLVFSSSTGGPLSAHNLGVREMPAACESAGVPRRSLYSLRHTCITLLLNGGIDVKTVAYRCGTSAAMIWRTYAHVLAESRSGSTDTIANALY